MFLALDNFGANVWHPEIDYSFTLQFFLGMIYISPMQDRATFWETRSIQTVKTSYNTSLAAPGALAHRLQRRTACKIQNGRQWAPKWPTGSGKVSIPRFLGILSNFR